jgi:hypothetical protein
MHLKALQYLANISALIFYFYTYTIISTVCRHYTQKIRSINGESKLLTAAAFIFALLSVYGAYILMNDIQFAVNTVINKINA